MNQQVPSLAEDRSLRVPLAFAPGAVPHARTVVSQCAAEFGDRAVADAELLTSEVVSNAVMHGAPPLQLTVTAEPDGLHVAVADGNDVLPALPAGEVDPDSPGGRGLRIVSALARDWGVVAGETGKTVWFRVTRPRQDETAVQTEHDHQKED